MDDDDVISKMWWYFAQGLNGDCGETGDLHIDWLNFGRIQGISLGKSESVYDLKNWMIDFDLRKISLEG